MSRGLKFLELISEEDLIILERALEPGAERSSQLAGNVVVKRIVEHGVGLLPSLPKKPGPKKVSSVNATDENLRRLLGNARAIMGLSSDEPRPTVLGILAMLIDDCRDICLENAFLTKDELTELKACGLRPLTDRLHPATAAGLIGIKNGKQTPSGGDAGSVVLHARDVLSSDDTGLPVKSIPERRSHNAAVFEHIVRRYGLRRRSVDRFIDRLLSPCNGPRG